ncbi:hypothetical protein B0H17DRAFT_1151495 [Mycena rosella]|uniref:Uncharacterized protein n=1 Tax=Mycena rosella TaxID=1033263 RepID=A0AAD7BJE9_MYCRO|nr:hypothetical protein B0H17DRAFT_1151495 [Mycena rosella]
MLKKIELPTKSRSQFFEGFVFTLWCQSGQLTSLTGCEAGTEHSSQPNTAKAAGSIMADARSHFQETYSFMNDIKHGLFPGPTPEKQFTIPSVPRMRDIPGHLPPAFTQIAPGEKRKYFVCPPRACQSTLWPDLVDH